MPLRDGFTLDVTAPVADFCDPRRRCYRVYTPCLGGVWTPHVHSPCAHNLVLGLLMRTMGPVPPPDLESLPSLQREFNELTRVVRGRVGRVERWDLERVVASYSEKRLRVRYEAALKSLRDDGYCTRRDARVSAFVKGEKLARYKTNKPRVIMARAPRYNLELASFLKPIEHALYPALRGWSRRFYTRTRLIGKGLSPRQRANLIAKKMAATADMVCFEVDGKSFESHFSLEVLRMEHRVYTSLLKDPRLRKLLRWQEEFEGSGCGVKFSVSGVRASGDFNTGLGNTLVMCCLVLATAAAIKTRFDFLADGDNAIIFIRKRHLQLWRDKLPGVFLRMGFEATLEAPAMRLEEVQFGQSRPCPVMGGLTMVRDPFKVMSHAACGYQHYGEIRGGLRVLKSVAYCEAVLSAGVPVLQAFAHSLLVATQAVGFARAMPSDYEYRQVLSKGISWASARKQPITREAREAFAVSWGVDPEEQARMERYFDQPISLPTEWPAELLETELPDGRDHWTLVSSRHSCYE